MLHPDHQAAKSLYNLRLQEAMLKRERRVLKPQRRSSHQLDRLLCELDYRRLVLAERLARFDLAQSILRAGETSLFSSGHCG